MSTQTRGFLFADLRGYSAYTERRGDDAARTLLGRYRRLVRAEIERYGGAEIRTEGDSFYVVFDSVRDAVVAGLAIGEAAAEASSETPADPIAVGIGIHAGETLDDEDEGIVSSAVNIAARVCGVAGAGEVLVTDTVRALTRGTLSFDFAPRGRRRLKGIGEPVALYRVTRDPAARTGRGRAAIAVAGLIVAVAALAGLGLSGIADNSSATEPGTSPDATPTTPTASSAASAEETHDLSRFFDDEYPTFAEQALLNRLLGEIAASCERADADDRPEFRIQEDDRGVAQTFPFRFRAGLTCLTDSTRVLYWQGADLRSNLASAQALFFDVATRLGFREGDCATESSVHGTWEAGLHSGKVLCYVNSNGHAVIEWTFDDANVYGIARRRDTETRALYEWWRETGVRLGR